MSKRVWCLLLLAGLIITVPALMRAQHPGLDRKFQTSDRCLACHNGLKTSSGEDISIGFDWRSGMMANSSRDPYWQGSVRRESIDLRNRAPTLKMSAPLATCPCLTTRQNGKAARLRCFPSCLLRRTPRNPLRLKMACHVRCVTRSAGKSWELETVSMADL